MKKTIFSLWTALLLCPSFAAAQQEGGKAEAATDTTVVAQSQRKPAAQQSSADSLAIYKSSCKQLQEQLTAAQIQTAALTREIIALKANLEKSTQTQQAAQTEITKLKSQLGKPDTLLVNMACNFLYIPYETYSVQEIAIPAADAVVSQELRSKRLVAFDLLRDYQVHVKQLADFIPTLKTPLSNPFLPESKKTELIGKLHQLPVYKAYQAYNDWKATYLGKKMLYLEQLIKTHTPKTKLDKFKNLAEELNHCLATN